MSVSTPNGLINKEFFYRFDHKRLFGGRPRPDRRLRNRSYCRFAEIALSAKRYNFRVDAFKPFF